MKKLAFVLTNGLYPTSDAKTAHGLVRGTERFLITGVIDQQATAGKDAGVILDGIHRSIPIYANLEDAWEAHTETTVLVIGVATVGGVLPTDMLVIIKAAIEKGLSIVNGLHDYLTDHADIVELAGKKGVSLTDIRKPKKRADLHFFTGDIFKLPTPVIAVIGMDCAMGKRTTARLLKEACAKEQIKTEMIYTGQTGWLQGNEYGFIFDSTLNDFVSGELENAILSCAREVNPSLIFLEGQSALRNPSGPCGLEFLISGNAKYTVLVFAPKRIYFDNEPHWGKIPSVESEIEIIEKFGSKVIALAMNTEGCTHEEALVLKAAYEEKLQLPVLAPLQKGVSELIPVLQQLIEGNKI
ncbi:DUF1611 domain-containing protein [Sediminibacterium sp. TEGAF015]|uniref:DUF1611 domain-containing protein n=1 Tax=Sediminibacterium sp. TEGAF015 TaxID=575378 RepID=UPI00220EA93E|nr:DUF1611 domain-containing protein [Sediminibacterium sp. TEGAF015]BDQ12770.1 hypothetical protein TEGAF0_19870 [Sediminibacterium sp. TEGAF015]